MLWSLLLLLMLLLLLVSLVVVLFFVVGVVRDAADVVAVVNVAVI